MLWTINGKRPVTFNLDKDATITVTDSMDNGTAVKSANGAATFTIGTSPVYVTDAGEVKTVSLGKPGPRRLRRRGTGSQPADLGHRTVRA